MRMNNDNKEKFKLFIWCLVAIGIMIWVVMNHNIIEETLLKILKTLIPFLYGASFAYILSPLCNKIEKRLMIKNYKHPHAMSTAITESIFLLLIILACIIIIPQSAKSIYSIIQSAPVALQNTQLFINEQLRTNKILHTLFGKTDISAVNTIEQFVNNTVMPNIDSITASVIENVTNIGKSIFNIIFGLIISIFALFNRKTFAKQSKMIVLAILGEKKSLIVFKKAHYANKVFSSFFLGKAIDSSIIGIICFIALVIMKIPYALLVSVIVTITNMIPIVGPCIGAVPGFIIIFSESPIKSLYFLVFIIILQQIDGHIIGPKCIGSATGLNTFWVLFSIIIFGRLFGIVGMFIGVPLFAVIYDIIRDIVYDNLDRKNIRKRL